ncbi:nicotinate mononucleotide-dependent phosphoribosyltransferase CobT [Halorubrum vacuolatum]|nr:TIGR00303 family protein [Halorubrum vacuolatum]
MRVILVVGCTQTGMLDGLSAAGNAPELLQHTPAADAEIVEYGRPICAPVTPVSPTGCPTPAVITRAVREMIDFDLLVVDAGLAADTAAPTLALGGRPGTDIREPIAVPNASALFKRARSLGRAQPDDAITIGESIPGGTTTALGVMTALGEPYGVSSSLPTNPVERKRNVVAMGLERSNIGPGDTAPDPLAAIRLMGDPVIAVVSGIVVGARETGARVTLAGGTQMLAVAAVIRHLGRTDELALATTRYVHEDETVDLESSAASLGLCLSVTDPGFERTDHQGLSAYHRGVGKEGVGMGGALRLATRNGVTMADVRDRTVTCYERLIDDQGP